MQYPKDTTLSSIMKEYKKYNYVAFYYPRLNKISLNGGRMLSLQEAKQEMRETLQRIYSKNFSLMCEGKIKTHILK